MSVIKLIPACKDYIWGGERLKSEYNVKSECVPLAEAWVLSTHKDGPSIIRNGPHKGEAFDRYIDRLGNEILGKNASKFDYFPILIKLIDAKDNLSVQVHPNDDYALKNENQYGKTEAWYILDCEPNAQLYYGFKSEISQSEFKERIENNTLTEVLNAVKVKKGDLFFIESGTIHAIGKGIVLAEIQQNSNVTYRVYDYARTDKFGKQRELHIDKALEVTSLNKPNTENDFDGHLVKCDYFTADSVSGDFSDVCDENSFVSVLITDGTGKIKNGDDELSFKKGDSLFLPADSGSFSLSGDYEAVITRI